MGSFPSTRRLIFSAIILRELFEKAVLSLNPTLWGVAITFGNSQIGKCEGKNTSQDRCSIPQGTSDSPSCNESAGTVIVQSKVEEARKRKNHEASTKQL